MQTVEFAFGANSIVHETSCELQYLSGTHCIISQVRQQYGDYKLREASMNVNSSGSSFGDNATGGLKPLSAVRIGQSTLARSSCDDDKLYIVHDSGDSILGVGWYLTWKH